MKLVFKSLLSILFITSQINISTAQTPPTTISSFTPTSGPVGTTVSITGTNFNSVPSNNVVYFGAVKAFVNSGTSTSLNVSVPAGTTYTPITVTNTITSTTGYSQFPFLPTFNNNAYIPGLLNFDTKVDLVSGSGNSEKIIICDIDGDGKPDLVAENDPFISIYRNTSVSGSLTTASFATRVDFSAGSGARTIAIGDLDVDGKPDIAVVNLGANTVSVFRNTATSGAITATSLSSKVDFITGASPDGIAIGDIDGDGKPELVVANFNSNTISVFRNTATNGSLTSGSFSAKVDFTAGTNPWSVAIGDFDTDGKPDIAVANQTSNNVSVFRNISTIGSITAGSLAAKIDFTAGTTPQNVSTGDLDGDGKLDLVVANYNSGVSVFRNTATTGSITASSFAVKVDFVVSGGVNSATIADINGDAKPDIVINVQGSNIVSIFRNTATSGSITGSSFSGKVDFNTASTPQSVVVGDLDGDGKPDLVAGYNTNTISVLRNNPVTNQNGASLNFDGVNDYVSIPQSSLLKPANAITIEAWVRASNIRSNIYYEIYRKEDGTSRHLLSFQNNGTLLSFGLGIGGTYSELQVSISPANYENQWVHVAATFDGSVRRIYRNGVLIGSQTISGLISTVGTAPAMIGSLSGTSEFFNGSIDELKIWSKALTQSEIQTNMNCEIQAQAGLIAYYKFNAGVAGGTNTGITTLYDWSGNNLNGTLINFALAGPTSNWLAPGGVINGNNCTTVLQTLAGIYGVNGYFFHPTGPRSINQSKSLIQVGPNTYQGDLGDLGSSGYSFQFTIDSNNNLINWVSVNATPALPASNFMTLDNPGNFTFTVTPLPGSPPYIQSIYNNTYNPVTHTFNMHYGYTVGSTSQNGYSRQIYEKWILPTPPKITSVTPMSGTYFTQVTITGKNFSTVLPSSGISFGNFNVDSAVIVSDSVIKAWVGNGASGYIKVGNPDGQDTLSGFTYTPVPAITNPQWQYVGNGGFSSNTAYTVTATIDRNNTPYVVFVDSASRKATVMKYGGSSWTTVGLSPSDGKCSNTKMVMDTTNNPVVAFSDSTNGGLITIKKYNGSSWINMALPTASGKYGLAIDGINRLYVLSMDTGRIKVFRSNTSGWDVTTNIGRSFYGDADITTDKTNNNPYIIFDDYNFNGQATVMKYNGSAWVNVGTPGFTSVLYGIFYPRIKIDTSGSPTVAFQEDNGFERVSVYKFSGGSWNPTGLRFSKSRSYGVTLAIDKKNNPYVAFEDFSYNKQGTVMTLDKNSGKWDTLGRRGFLPSLSLEANSLLLDSANTPYIAFSDISKGGKVSVMKLNIYCYNNVNAWTGAVSNIWGDGGNWGCGVVPISTSDPLISGSAVLLGSNTTTGSITLTNGATIQLGKFDLNIGNGNLIGSDSVNYIITNDSGMLVRNVGTAPTLFPIGFSSSSYTPATITNTGTSSDNFKVRVGLGVQSTGNSVTPDTLVTMGTVNRTWYIQKEGTGNSSKTVTLQWNLGDEQNSFNRSNSYISHYQVCPPPINCAGGFYDGVSRTAASSPASNIYTQTRNNVTSFNTPIFIVTSQEVVYNFVNTTGNGNWDDQLNWSNERIPPTTITDGMNIVIEPATGQCNFTGTLTIQPGGKLTVKPGIILNIIKN